MRGNVTQYFNIINGKKSINVKSLGNVDKGDLVTIDFCDHITSILDIGTKQSFPIGNSIKFSTTGKYLVIVLSNQVMFFDTSDYSICPVMDFSLPFDIEEQIVSVAWSEDDKYCFIGSSIFGTKSVIGFRESDKAFSFIGELTDHNLGVSGIEFISDTLYLSSSSKYNPVWFAYIFDRNTDSFGSPFQMNHQPSNSLRGSAVTATSDNKYVTFMDSSGCMWHFKRLSNTRWDLVSKIATGTVQDAKWHKKSNKLLLTTDNNYPYFRAWVRTNDEFIECEQQKLAYVTNGPTSFIEVDGDSIILSRTFENETIELVVREDAFINTQIVTALSKGKNCNGGVIGVDVSSKDNKSVVLTDAHPYVYVKDKVKTCKRVTVLDTLLNPTVQALAIAQNRMDGDSYGKAILLSQRNVSFSSKIVEKGYDFDNKWIANKELSHEVIFNSASVSYTKEEIVITSFPGPGHSGKRNYFTPSYMINVDDYSRIEFDLELKELSQLSGYESAVIQIGSSEKSVELNKMSPGERFKVSFDIDFATGNQLIAIGLYYTSISIHNIRML